MELADRGYHRYNRAMEQGGDAWAKHVRAVKHREWLKIVEAEEAIDANLVQSRNAYHQLAVDASRHGAVWLEQVIALW